MGKFIWIRKTLNFELNNVEKNKVLKLTLDDVLQKSYTVPNDCDITFAITLLKTLDIDTLTGAQAKALLADLKRQTLSKQLEE